MKRSIKKSIPKIISITLLFVILFSFSACTIIRERERVYNEINEIEKSSDYTIITSRNQVFATKQIDFINIIQKKLSEDGHIIKDALSSRFDRFGNHIAFIYQYRSENRFWGINNLNNCWAIGMISLDDYAIEIHYLRNKYEEMKLYALSQTYFALTAMDSDYKKTNEHVGKITKYDYFTLDRSKGKIKFVDNQEELLRSIGQPLKNYTNPRRFTYNGKTYIISNSGYIRDEDYNGIAELSNNSSSSPVSFTYSDVLPLSPELQKINQILGEVSEYEIACHFLTNGEDLFVGFVTEMTLFGPDCKLTCPVIFKTDLNFDSFEYIGCVHPDYMTDFFDEVEIKKIA